MAGDFTRRRGTSQTLRQLLDGPFELGAELFHSPGNLYRPSVIAEVSANFAHYGWNGERQEIRAVVDVEAVHRLDQTHPGHLDEILECFSTVLEAASDVFGQRETSLYDHFSATAVLT